MNYKKYIKAGSLSAIIVLLLVCQALVPRLVKHGSAATMTQTFVRTDKMTISSPTTGTVCAMSPTAASATETSVKVTFPTGYTVSSTVGNWAVSTATTTGWPTGGTAWTGIAVPTGTGEFVVSGQSVNFVSGNLASGSTLYCFNWTNTAALTTKSSATNDNTGTVITQTTGGVASDTGSYATATVSNDSIAVTATVNPSFQMSFSGGNTDALGTLTTGAVASSATTTMTVNTNAKNGWMAWARDSSPAGLTSTAASYTISPTGVGSASQALVAGTEGYNTGIAYSQSSGTCTAGSAVNANFDKAGGANKGGGLDTTLRTILTCGGTTASGVITPTVFAAINGATPAASDYADTQTYVAAGLF